MKKFDVQDRIEVNGVWYVREEDTKEVELECILFNGRVYETDDYTFEVTQIIGSDNTPHDYCYIELTHKNPDIPSYGEDSGKEYIDSPSWMFKIHEDDPEGIEEASEMMDRQGLREFKEVLKDLIDIKWLNKPIG